MTSTNPTLDRLCSYTKDIPKNLEEAEKIYEITLDNKRYKLALFKERKSYRKFIVVYDEDGNIVSDYKTAWRVYIRHYVGMRIPWNGKERENLLKALKKSGELAKSLKKYSYAYSVLFSSKELIKLVLQSYAGSADYVDFTFDILSTGLELFLVLGVLDMYTEITSESYRILSKPFDELTDEEIIFVSAMIVGGTLERLSQYTADVLGQAYGTLDKSWILESFKDTFKDLWDVTGSMIKMLKNAEVDVKQAEKTKKLGDILVNVSENIYVIISELLSENPNVEKLGKAIANLTIEIIKANVGKILGKEFERYRTGLSTVFANSIRKVPEGDNIENLGEWLFDFIGSLRDLKNLLDFIAAPVVYESWNDGIPNVNSPGRCLIYSIKGEAMRRPARSSDSIVNVIPYWIEHDENGKPLKNVWIKLSLKSNTPKTIYVYYDESAPNLSNGDAVFVFFDDFDKLDKKSILGLV